MTETIQLDRAVRVPHLDQWLGYWLMEPDRGLQKLAALQQMNIALHVHQAAGGRAVAAAGEGVTVRSGYAYELRDGVAIVELAGTLMKHEASDESSTSTVMMRRTVRAIGNDAAAKAVIFIVDSPGGTVAGAYDLSDDIAALSALKPTYAYVPDLMASAAYLQGSQMRGISAGRTALVGSIGTVAVVYDSSARATMQGYKVHVLRGRINGEPAPFKGAGAPGSEVMAEQLERWQVEIDDLNEQFLRSVASGRKMPRAKVEEIADGGVWIADRAKALGLIDRVETFDQLFSRVSHDAGRASANGGGGGSTKQQDAGGATAAGSEGTTVTAAVADQAGSGADASGLDGSGSAEEKETSMSQTNGAPAAGTAVAEQPPKPATMAELKAALAGASSDFLVEQAEKGVTLAQAKDNFLQWQAAQIRGRDEEIGKLKQERPAAGATTTETATKRPGTQAVESNPAKKLDLASASSDDGTATGQFKAMVEAKVSKGMARDRAVSQVARENPEIHAAMIEEANEAPAKR
jgi:signal peptide peptidase SppA